MPVMHVSMDGLEQAVTDAERSGRIVSVSSDGAGGVLILVEPKRGKSEPRETR